MTTSGDDDDDDVDSLLAMIARPPQRHVPLHLVGTRRFELGSKLGGGTFGDVYEARDREHGSVVALKALKSSQPDWIYRFKREFRILGDLAHPNLVRMFELFVEDDRWYLTMERIEGVRFDAFVRQTPGSLRSCFGQLALGLAELHRAGCLHRDVKPSNAMVEPSGHVVLLDFGLAVNQHAALASAIAGTSPYMAPELGLRLPATEATDWYSFGVMLYEALAGELPFAGDEAEMLRAKRGPPPPAPSELRSQVDPALEALALRLLATDPAARPEAAEVLGLLVAATTHGGAVATARRSDEPIFGRDVELAELATQLEASRHHPVVVEVCGPPGMGKTALVEAFVAQLRTGQATVYQGRGLELESVPFKGLDGAIDELCNDLSRRRLAELPLLDPSDVAALVRMFPMVKRVEALSRRVAPAPDDRGPSELHRSAARALRGVFAGLGPLVLFLDDLQWTGQDSLDLLLEVLAAPAPSLLLVVAHRGALDRRPPSVERFVAGLTARGLPPVAIEVRPLEPASVEAWIATRAAPMSTDHAMRESTGHPDLLSRLLLHAGAATDEPIMLAHIVERALVELDEAGRLLVETVAIAGGPTSASALFEAVGTPYDPQAIDQLRRRRLIQSTATAHGSALDTYHARVRETVLAAISPDRGRALAARLATLLEAPAAP